MDGYDKNSQNGKMSLEDVLELYNGQEDKDKKDSSGYIYKETSLEDDTSTDNIKIPVEELTIHKDRKPLPKKRRRASFAEASSWFQTICWLNIPVFGFFYMFVLLIRKKTPVHKKNFIIGYIMYKALVWLLAIVLVYWLYKTGLDFIDGMLRYVT